MSDVVITNLLAVTERLTVSVGKALWVIQGRPKISCSHEEVISHLNKWENEYKTNPIFNSDVRFFVICILEALENPDTNAVSKEEAKT